MVEKVVQKSGKSWAEDVKLVERPRLAPSYSDEEGAYAPHRRVGHELPPHAGAHRSCGSSVAWLENRFNDDSAYAYPDTTHQASHVNRLIACEACSAHCQETRRGQIPNGEGRACCKCGTELDKLYTLQIPLLPKEDSPAHRGHVAAASSRGGASAAAAAGAAAACGDAHGARDRRDQGVARQHKHKEQKAAHAPMYHGRVKTVVKEGDQHYAFLECTELGDKYARKDVFVPGKTLGDLTLVQGDLVAFSYKVHKDQPQAIEIIKVDDAPTRSARPPALSADGDFAVGAKEPEDAPTFRGIVKSFSPESGYGFVASPESLEKYGCDVFLHARQIKEFDVGDNVYFAVRLNSQCRPQAFDLRAVPSSVSWLTPEPASSAAAPAAVPAAAAAAPAVAAASAQHEGEAFEEQKYIGDIKSYSPNKGYGFIECPELWSRFSRDVFIHQVQLEGKKVGDRVAFRMQVKEGKPQALDVVLVSDMIQPASSALANGSVAGATAAATAHVGGVGGAGHCGSAPSGPLRAPRPDTGSAAASTAAAVSMAEQATREMEKAQAELNTRLLRACASVRLEAWDTMRELLAARADANFCDVTGQTPMMIAALNNRHSERKCKLLFEHRADMDAPCCGDLNVVQWARQRINASFAKFLQAVKNGETPDVEMALEGPCDDF